MKGQLILIPLVFSMVLSAQSQAQTEAGNTFFDQLLSNATILTEGGLIKGTNEVKGFVTDFTEQNGDVDAYEKQFSIEVSSTLAYEIGEARTDGESFSVMFLRRKGDTADAGIEFLVIYKKQDPQDQLTALTQFRAEWMELCNSHQTAELVKRLYTADAYYYNRGRLLQGTGPITKEYSYMNSPNYSLKLTPRHVVFVTPSIAYEVGQCSGSYNKPYMLLWEKNAEGKWQVLMDSND